MKRKASAHWEGGLKDGKGTVSTQSGVLDKNQYSFGTRFEDGKGTNPEELIGAAHASTRERSHRKRTHRSVHTRNHF